MSRRTSATPSSRNQRNESVCTSMRFGKLLDLAKLREGKTLTGRETSQRHSNPERIKLRKCGTASRAASSATKGADARQPGRSGARRAGARKIGEHERADTGTPSIASRHAGCQSPRHVHRPLTRMSRPAPGCSAQDTPEPAGWQRLSGQIFPARRPGPPELAYLSSTEAPASSSLALAFSASSFEAFSTHRLGGAVDEVLGLLQAQARELAHDLDHLDLLVAGRDEDDVELVLLLGGLGRGAARRRRRPRPRPGPRR